MITNTDYTDKAVLVAKDEGIGLFIVKPAFDTNKMPRSRNLALAHIQGLRGKPYNNRVVWKGLDVSAPHTLGAPAPPNSLGQYPIHPLPAPAIPSPQQPPPVASASGAGQASTDSGARGTPFPYQTRNDAGPGFLKK
jgi:hypothetical protein